MPLWKSSYSCFQVDPRFAIPLYSIGLTALISCLLGLINIGSSVAFNAIISLVAAGFFSTYIITITLMIRKRLSGEPIEFGPWNMGRWGLAVNVYAVLYSIIVTVFSFFPPATPVTAVSMSKSLISVAMLEQVSNIFQTGRARCTVVSSYLGWCFMRSVVGSNGKGRSWIEGLPNRCHRRNKLRCACTWSTQSTFTEKGDEVY